MTKTLFNITQAAELEQAEAAVVSGIADGLGVELQRAAGGSGASFMSGAGSSAGVPQLALGGVAGGGGVPMITPRAAEAMRELVEGVQVRTF